MSQSFNEVLGGLNPGDIVKLSVTLRVQSRDEIGVLAEEVRTGASWGIGPEMDDNTSAKLQVVKKAVYPQPRKPRRQDFKEGDTISGETLREVMWRRGTFIRLAGVKSRHGYILHGDGRWHSIGVDGVDYGFDRFVYSDGYEIVYLPE